MRKASNYVLLSDLNIANLESLVVTYLIEGWQLYGSPFFVPIEDDVNKGEEGGGYCQALIICENN